MAKKKRKKKNKRIEERLVVNSIRDIGKELKEAEESIYSSMRLIFGAVVIIVVLIIAYFFTTGANRQSAVAIIDRVESLGKYTMVSSKHTTHTYKYNYYVHFTWNGKEYNCVALDTLKKNTPAIQGSEVKVYFEELIKDGDEVILKYNHIDFWGIVVFLFVVGVVPSIGVILFSKYKIKAIREGKKIEKIDSIEELCIGIVILLVVFAVIFLYRICDQ